MLDNLRANKGGIITYVFLFAIIIVFVVSFGPGSFDKGCSGRQGESWAAVVNGTTVPVSEYERAYSGLMRTFQQQAGSTFTREMAEQMGLASMALGQVVDRELVIQAARRDGLFISDAELARTIFELPGFQTNGAFDKDLYQRSVASGYGSPGRFEAALREDLLYQRMIAAVRQTVKVSPAEVQQAWSNEHDRVTLTFVRFPLAGAEAELPKPSAADLAAFTAKEGARIDGLYKENAARFDQPRKVRASHILAKIAAGATPAQVDAARARIDGAAARVAKGEDFAKVAADLSEDTNTRAKGGDLGFVAEGLVDKPFADAAFAMAPKQVSAPVRGAAGWHLIKVTEVVEARKTPLEAARADIARELLTRDRAAELAMARAATALAAVKAGQHLGDLFPSEESAAKAKRKAVRLGGELVAADTTGPFTGSAAFVPRLGQVSDLQADALKVEAGRPLARVYPTALGPVVAVVEKRERPDPSKWEAQREEEATRLRNRKEQAVFGAWVKQLRDGAEVRTNAALTRAAPAEAG